MSYEDRNIPVEHREEKKSITGWLIGGAVLAAAAVGLILFTDIDLTERGSLPEVSVEGGELPEVDIDVADVDVGTRTIEVKVPTVDVDLPEEKNETDDLADDIEIDADLDVRIEDER